MSRLPPLSLSPHHPILGILPEPCTKLNSHFAFDRCAFGLQMDGKEEGGGGEWGKLPSVSPYSLGKRGGFLADLVVSTRAEKQIRKLPMASFTLGNWVTVTLSVKPSMHKSQEIHNCHSHSQPWLATHWLTLCPGFRSELSPCQSAGAMGGSILGICLPQKNTIKGRWSLHLLQF